MMHDKSKNAAHEHGSSVPKESIRAQSQHARDSVTTVEPVYKNSICPEDPLKEPVKDIELLELREKTKELEKIVVAVMQKLVDLEVQIQQLWKLVGMGENSDDGDRDDYEDSDELDNKVELPNQPRGKAGETINNLLLTRRTVSSRSPETIILKINVEITMEQEKLVNHIFDVNASKCGTLRKFWTSLSPFVAEYLAKEYKSINRLSDDFLTMADTSLILEEDGHIATMNITPTRPHKSCFPELTYHGWYLRNVLRGRNQEYRVDVKVRL